MNGSGKVKWAMDKLHQLGCSPVEVTQLAGLARSMKLGTAQSPVSFEDSFVSMAQSVEKGGAQQKDKLLELAHVAPEERDAFWDLYSFIKKTVSERVAEVADKGRTEGEAKREFRGQLLEKLMKMYPGADEPTLYLTIGQCFEDTPGNWGFNVSRCVLALRNQRRFG